MGRKFLVITNFLKSIEELAQDSEYKKLITRFAKKLGSSVMSLRPTLNKYALRVEGRMSED